MLEHRAHLGYREDWDMEGEQEVERAGVRRPHPDSPLPVIGVEVVLPHKLRVVTPDTSMGLHQPTGWGYTIHQHGVTPATRHEVTTYLELEVCQPARQWAAVSTSLELIWRQDR